MQQTLLDNDNNQKREQFMQVKRLFQCIFNPQQFEISKGINQIIRFGGLTNIMSLLQISHRQGLSSYSNHNLRQQIFGSNTPSKQQNILKTSFIAQTDFTINLLLYIIALRFCIKILFIRDGLQTQSIFDQCISFILLLIMTLLKAMVNIEFYKMDQNQRKYKNQEWIQVKRDAEIVQIQQKNILVGDIIIVNADDVIRIDGIIIKSNDLSINQAQTILRQDSKKKQSFLNIPHHQEYSINNNQKYNHMNSSSMNNQNYYNMNSVQHQFDPFILAGSSVIYGNGQILVCKVGEQCSFRIKNQKMQAYLQNTVVISQLKKMLNFVQYSSKVIVLLCSTYYAIYYLLTAIQSNALTWLTFLSILKTYSSYIGFICIIQRLKIVRSLQFFLQSYRSDKNFRIKNKCTLQKLSEIDLILIDKQVLYIIQTERGYIMPKLQIINQMNKYFNVKIVTTLKIDKLLEQFDMYDTEGNVMIQSTKIYKKDQNQSAQDRINKLNNCYFITQCKKEQLLNQLIPIYNSLQYNICYIYKSKANNKEPLSISTSLKQLSSQIMTINFIEQSYGPLVSQQSQWVQIKNTSIIQDHLQSIIQKGFIFAQLYNIYMIQFINNIIVFLSLCFVSIKRNYTIDFYWSLIIIITARYIFFKIYKKIVLDRLNIEHEKISYKKIIKYNLFLLIYYVLVIINIEQKNNIVCFFICNAMLRTEILLLKVEKVKYSIKNLLNFNIFANLLKFNQFANLLKFNLFAAIVLAGNILVKKWINDSINQELLLVKYVAILSILLTIYGLFN